MKRIYIIISYLILAVLTSCEKDFLSVKPDKKLVVPQTLKDIQALLDNELMFTTGLYFGEVGAGDFFLEHARWLNLMVSQKNAYIWAKDVYEGTLVDDWNNGYSKVFYANTALEAINEIEPAKAEKALDEAKGHALFERAWVFYGMAQQFCKPYSMNNLHSPGLPLRLETDLNLVSVRATVEDTYQRIIHDTKESLILLPITPIVKTRPSRPAAYGLLAKTYLMMGDYYTAGLYADSCINLYPDLLDYSSLDPAATYPFSQFNKEVIFHELMLTPVALIPSRLTVEEDLFESYTDGDLRKALFYYSNAGRTTYKGSYNGNTGLFSGIAADEMYLIRAEAAARAGKVAEALSDLNYLLKHRFSGIYINLNSSDQTEVLRWVLNERRKELVYRGIRWSDLRRLNMDPIFQITLKRTLNSEVFILPPNDDRYVLPFPDEVIKISGMPQNPR